MTKGDIILIPFPFTDLSGNKLRPAVVLYQSEIDITVCFISTQTKWKELTDIELLPTERNGLKRLSIVRLSKMATIDKALALGKLGQIGQNEIITLNKNLKIIFQLE
jgi:mRNA interferase MazF